VESAHPSPLSARTGFFGSRPFSRTNALLTQQGAPGLDWSLPEAD
jgi:uracil-DNA glycosylase